MESNKLVMAMDAMIASETVLGANGMPALVTSGDANVNFFGAVGGLRGRNNEALELFKLAYAEDKTIAIANLFNTRDPRDGMGERSIVVEILNYLMVFDNSVFLNILPFVPVYGRWKDLFEINVTTYADRKAIASLIIANIGNDETNALMAKYIPLKSKNKNVSKTIGLIRIGLNKTPKQFRDLIVGLRSGVVEVAMSSKKFDEIDYSKVPSMAMKKYFTAFYKRDEDRFSGFMNKVKTGESKMNASVLNPADVVDSIYNDRYSKNADSLFLDNQWNSLKDHFGNTPDGLSILPVIDVSSSMSGAGVMGDAIGLGIYLSEKNKGALKNYACSFSDEPRIFKIPETDIVSKVMGVLDNENVGYSTNFEATIQLIAELVVENDIPDSEVPLILFLSDMNFNQAQGNNGLFSRSPEPSEKQNLRAVEVVKSIFTGKYGRKAPKVVYWNLAHNGSLAAESTVDGFALTSGKSASQVKSVLNSIDSFNPKSIMMTGLAPYMANALKVVKG